MRGNEFIRKKGIIGISKNNVNDPFGRDEY